MAVKIITDSSADLPDQLAEEMGITVIPLYVRFGDEVHRDRVDITEDEFYRRLEHDPVHPSTIQPTPQDFAEIYQRLVTGADGIVSIHISGKLSGTCNSALMAKEMMEFTKNNILNQAATAMLAQANQQPQGVLQLLR